MSTPTNPLIGIYQNQPTDVNFLITNRFRLVLRRAPNVVYWVQSCNLPGFGMGNPTQPTPFVDVPLPGDKIVYQDFNVTFPVDEEMKNYREIADWIVGLGFPKQFGQYKDLSASIDGIESDVGLVILDSNHQPKHIVTFVGAFPVSITGIDFDSKSEDTVIPNVTVTFKYAYWTFTDTDDSSNEINA